MKFLLALSISLICSYSLWGNDMIDSLGQELTNTSNPLKTGQLQIALAQAYQRFDLGKSLQYAKLARETISGIDSLEVQALDLIGRSYFFQSKLDSALWAFRAKRDVFQKNQEEDKIANSNISIGSVLLRQGAFEEAVNTFISSVQYFEKEGDDGGAAKCYTNLATAFAELDDFQSAIDYSLKALPILRNLEMLQVEMILLPNLATQYLKNDDTENALRYYKEAEQLALENNGKRALALIYNNLGDLYLTNEEYDLAEEYLNKAIKEKKELDQTKGLDAVYFNLGLINYKKRNYNKALQLYNQSIPTAEGFGKVKILYAMKDLQRDLGNDKRALEYADQARVLSDSLNYLESKTAISDLNAKYNSAKQENEILKLTSDNQSLELVKIRNRFWALLLGSALAISILTLYLNWKGAKRKRVIAEQQHTLEQQQMLDKISHHEQEVIEKMIVGQEEERKRIAGDLHDSLGSKLSTLKRYIEKISISKPVESDTIRSAMTLADDSYAEVRKIAHEMNSGMLVEQGLLPALDEMVRNKSNAHDIMIIIHVNDMEGRLENYLEIQIFRIIQELTNNAIKHASASEIEIQLTRYDDYLNLIVEDDGVGFPVEDARNGMGLNNINRRLSKIKGSINIDSSPKSGTTAIINIQL